MNLLIKNAELLNGTVCDIQVRNGRIERIASDWQLATPEIIDADGRACGIALQDHHIHLRATAALERSLRCDDGAVASSENFEQRIRSQPVDENGWIRVVGFHESQCGQLNAERLDQIRSDVPIRVQHVSGRLWILNRKAQQILSSGPWDGDGCLWDQDAWLSRRMRKLGLNAAQSLDELSRRLASFGLVGVTDTSPKNTLAEFQQFAEEQRTGSLRQRLLMMGDASLNQHYSTADQTADRRLGPRKFHLLESALPELDELSAEIERAHAVERPVAFHCVSRTELVFALAALEQGGIIAGDRIEHAGICPDDLLPSLKRLTVVTQPVFIHDRGDRYLDQVDPSEHANLYRLHGLTKAGISVAGSSDAPYGDLNPWQGIAAARQRQTRSGKLIGADEAVEFDQAYGLWTGTLLQPGRARQVSVGEVADICLWNRSWDDIRQQPELTKASLTLKAGEPIWRDGL